MLPLRFSHRKGFNLFEKRGGDACFREMLSLRLRGG